MLALSDTPIGGSFLFIQTRKPDIFLAGLIACLLFGGLGMAAAAHAQTYTVLHTFTSGADGAVPYVGLVMDRGGNFYGATQYGGNVGSQCANGQGCGVVFKLSRAGSSWALTPIYTFQGAYTNDGYAPTTRVIFGPDGALYGATYYGGGPLNYGTVFRLKPQPTACKTSICPWLETILHSFQGQDTDGSAPDGDVTFDSAGNLYGTTWSGGRGLCDESPCGTVYEMSNSGGQWTESVIHDFADGPGYNPLGPVTIDSSGNLYGTTSGSSGPDSAVYELLHAQGWPVSSLYSFLNASEYSPYGGVIFDTSGNLYSTTAYGGSGNGGTVFELTPSGGNWNIDILYSFTPTVHNGAVGPTSTLTMDAAGSLYGNTYSEGVYGFGNIFKLTPTQDGWTYTSLYDFTGGSDGGHPYGQVILDADGNIFGTTTGGGLSTGSCRRRTGCGVAFEITQ